MKNLCLFIAIFVFSTVLGVAQELSEVEFSYTGAVQEWTVPEGITYLEIEAAGARGGLQTRQTMEKTSRQFG